MKILVVDDRELIREAMRGALKELNGELTVLVRLVQEPPTSSLRERFEIAQIRRRLILVGRH
jgi:DNA-binding NarL/FixJ family response regulator